jgi:hypothetical protein
MAKVFEKLKDPKEEKIGNLTCYVSKIPAFYAQRILLAGGEALTTLNMTKLPESVILELLSYTAVENANGGKVVLDSIELVNVMIENPKDLIALELKLVEYNFGFFFDGSLREVFDPLTELLNSGSARTSTPSAAS